MCYNVIRFKILSTYNLRNGQLVRPMAETLRMVLNPVEGYHIVIFDDIDFDIHCYTLCFLTLVYLITKRWWYLKNWLKI